MRRHLRQRFWAHDGDPGPVAWIIASISIVLPVAGLVLCLVGGAQLMRGDGDGWALLGTGVACIVADILIDFAWAHPGVSESDQPDLNRRSAQLVGRVAVVVEPIDGGRGKIRVGDTIWPAEGPELPAGASVRVVAAGAMVLVVEGT